MAQALTGLERAVITGVNPTTSQPSATPLDIPVGQLATMKQTSNALTALGSTRADALAFVGASCVHRFTTVAASTGCVLPAGKQGLNIIIFNDGASPLTVYGNGTDTIDGVAAATGVPLANAKRCVYFCVANGVWISAQLGVVSA